MIRWVAGVCVAAMLPVSALAQQPAPVTVEISPFSAAATDGTIVHALSGTKFPKLAAGLSRGEPHLFAQDGSNVSIPYGTPADGTWITVYIYRAAYPGAGLWLSQADMQIRARFPVSDTGRSEKTITFGDSPVPNGKSVLYRFSDPAAVGGTTFTGVSIAQLDQWLVKFRISSTAVDQAAVEARLSQLVAAINWPTLTKNIGALDAPATCAESMKTVPFKQLKLKQDDLMQLVLVSLLADTLALGPVPQPEKPEKKDADFSMRPDVQPAAFCQQPVALGSLKMNAIRPLGAATPTMPTYTLLLADSGRAVNVTSTAIAATVMDKKKVPSDSYSISVLDGGKATSVTVASGLTDPVDAANIGMRVIAGEIGGIITITGGGPSPAQANKP